jgi:hypothetical protein
MTSLIAPFAYLPRKFPSIRRDYDTICKNEIGWSPEKHYLVGDTSTCVVLVRRSFDLLKALRVTFRLSSNDSIYR